MRTVGGRAVKAERDAVEVSVKRSDLLKRETGLTTRHPKRQRTGALQDAGALTTACKFAKRLGVRREAKRHAAFARAEAGASLMAFGAREGGVAADALPPQSKTARCRRTAFGSIARLATLAIAAPETGALLNWAAA